MNAQMKEKTNCFNPVNKLYVAVYPQRAQPQYGSNRKASTSDKG